MCVCVCVGTSQSDGKEEIDNLVVSCSVVTVAKVAILPEGDNRPRTPNGPKSRNNTMKESPQQHSYDRLPFYSTPFCPTFFLFFLF